MVALMDRKQIQSRISIDRFFVKYIDYPLIPVGLPLVTRCSPLITLSDFSYHNAPQIACLFIPLYQVKHLGEQGWHYSNRK